MQVTSDRADHHTFELSVFTHITRAVRKSRAESESSSVDVVGPSDAAPLVLVHGTVFNRTMWAPQREVLSDAFRVIVPDLPGHGERRNESFDLEEAVGTVAEVVDRHADGRVHLVGLSLGGYVATEFAHRHPQKVENLVLSSSSANPVGLLGVLSRISGGTALLASKSRLIERGVDRLAAWWVRNQDLDQELQEEIVDAGFDLRPFGEAGFEIAGEDFRASFASFDGPALVLNGQLDLLMRLGEKAHADAAEDARVSVIDGAGHTCNLERTDEYEAAVRDFITADR